MDVSTINVIIGGFFAIAASVIGALFNAYIRRKENINHRVDKISLEGCNLASILDSKGISSDLSEMNEDAAQICKLSYKGYLETKIELSSAKSNRIKMAFQLFLMIVIFFVAISFLALTFTSSENIFIRVPMLVWMILLSVYLVRILDAAFKFIETIPQTRKVNKQMKELDSFFAGFSFFDRDE